MSSIAFTVTENKIIGLSDGVYFNDFEGNDLGKTDFRKVYKPAPNYLAFVVGNMPDIFDHFFRSIEEANKAPGNMKELVPGIQELIKMKYDEFAQGGGKIKEVSHGVFIIGYDQKGRIRLYELTKDRGESHIREPKTHWPYIDYTICICDDLENAPGVFRRKLDESLQSHSDHEKAALEAFTNLVNEQKNSGKRVGGEIYIKTIERP
ncbi:MAG: hypothetical protein HUJ22_04670 [Gracilimonas sp.]|uniref:hypothetical protein n=1 Tax=Gracilimonas sp. TaxID=1974203 RepID=UPI0019BB3B94|nr:hypothetical protein [Gracilimonas sp.]MBD3615846.1 hypothetical protein [Gracilimonas sp.]